MDGKIVLFGEPLNSGKVFNRIAVPADRVFDADQGSGGHIIHPSFHLPLKQIGTEDSPRGFNGNGKDAGDRRDGADLVVDDMAVG